MDLNPSEKFSRRPLYLSDAESQRLLALVRVAADLTVFPLTLAAELVRAIACWLFFQAACGFVGCLVFARSLRRRRAMRLRLQEESR